jgi:hypothetical protein
MITKFARLKFGLFTSSSWLDTKKISNSHYAFDLQDRGVSF